VIIGFDARQAFGCYTVVRCLFVDGFGKSIRKMKTMVQLQVAMRAVAKSRPQIKPKPNSFMQKDVRITCCKDGTRPVIFKIERIDVEEVIE